MDTTNPKHLYAYMLCAKIAITISLALVAHEKSAHSIIKHIKSVYMHTTVCDGVLNVDVFVLFRLHFRFCFYVNLEAIKFTTQYKCGSKSVYCVYLFSRLLVCCFFFLQVK